MSLVLAVENIYVVMPLVQCSYIYFYTMYNVHGVEIYVVTSFVPEVDIYAITPLRFIRVKLFTGNAENVLIFP